MAWARIKIGPAAWESNTTVSLKCRLVLQDSTSKWHSPIHTDNFPRISWRPKIMGMCYNPHVGYGLRLLWVAKKTESPLTQTGIVSETPVWDSNTLHQRCETRIVLQVGAHYYVIWVKLVILFLALVFSVYRSYHEPSSLFHFGDLHLLYIFTMDVTVWM